MSDSYFLTPTLEDYLEAICRLVHKTGRAHVQQIAEAVSVHKSTVSTALRSLAEKGLVNYEPYQAATLTEKGRDVGEEICSRHELIRHFLSEILLLDEKSANENACRMEHAMDEEALRRLSFFAGLVRNCPRTGQEWLDRFRYHFEHGCPPKDEEAAKRLEEFRKKLGKEAHRAGGKTVITLDNLKAGQKAKIINVGTGGAVRRRIVDMGLVRGTPVEVVKVAPLGDPIEVKVKGYSLSLRKDEAAAIEAQLE